ncbi:MAG: hypothetical protein CMN32_09755 [Saprospirales bacterium]|nr:hypothetical protein [Saprospirales bacterium]
MRYLLPFLTIVLFIQCKNEPAPADSGDKLGELHFSYSGSPEAMEHFEKGLKLLHNFEYADAKAAFEEAQKLDSACVMAWWGEAMTYNHPLWRQQDREAAIETLEELGATAEERLAKAPTELEKDFLASLEALYFAEGEKNERDAAYRDHLAAMYEKYAGNEEVAAFYALSVLGAVPVGRDEAEYERSAGIVKGILNENPEHPGALHYLIHSYDDPYHARLALNAAQRYSVVAADATHALHMPSHIFLAVGMWKEVVESNIASYNASVRRMEEKGLDNDARSYHAFAWLQYGLLQLGRLDEAEKIMREMYGYTTELPSKSARSYFASMKGTYLLHTDDWDSDIADFSIDMEGMGIVSRSQYHFTEGWKAWKDGDKERLSALIDTMADERKKAALLVTDSGIPMCAATPTGQGPNQLDIDWAHVMEMELKALREMLNGNDEQAEFWLKSATDLQSSISYDYGPPAILKPAHEMYGDFLLQHGRPGEALAAYETALERAPKRRLALEGKLAAAQAAGEEKAIAEAKAVLEEIGDGTKRS